MIHAYHATFGTYGSWLPNDPRGSASRFVGGSKMYLQGGRPVQSKRLAYDRLTSLEKQKHNLLQSQLVREPVVLSETQIDAIAIAIGTFITNHRLQVWAAAILPCHVHVVFSRCGRKAELVIDEMKDFCNERIVAAEIAPVTCSRERSIWANGQWIVFQDNEAAIESAIAYVLQKPIDEGRDRQCWPFVVPFQGIESNIVSYRD